MTDLVSFFCPKFDIKNKSTNTIDFQLNTYMLQNEKNGKGTMDD